jgi:cell wall-associated NlpC family hydrolase
MFTTSPSTESLVNSVRFASTTHAREVPCLLTGTAEAVAESEWEDIEAVVEAAMGIEAVTVYRLTAEEWTGYRHTGLPTGFDGGSDNSSSMAGSL